MAKKLLQQKLILPVNHYWLFWMPANGKVMRKLPNPDQYFFTYPVFSKNDDKIFSAVRNPAGQMALVAFNIANGSQRILVPFTYKSIAFTRVRGDLVSIHGIV